MRKNFRRFVKIDTTKSKILDLIENLKTDGFKEVANRNGGDDDFLVIDTVNKEFVWCESGEMPFCSYYELNKITASTTLADMVKDRW